MFLDDTNNKLNLIDIASNHQPRVERDVDGLCIECEVADREPNSVFCRDHQPMLVESSPYFQASLIAPKKREKLGGVFF